MSRAAKVENRAAHFIMRREEPNWSDADQDELDAWLAESMAHKAAYWRLAHGWEQADRLAALGPVNVVPLRRTWRPRLIGTSLLAASLVASALLGLGYMERTGRPDPAVLAQAFDTPVGGRRTIALSDGSRIELNTSTRLRAVVADGRRETWLDSGEAFFKIVHDPAHPFIVHAGDRQVTVLGTSFSVRVDNGQVRVSVIEGRVRVDPIQRPTADTVPTTTLGRGEMAIARGTETLISTDSIERVDRDLAWRRGMISFDQSTLAEVVAEFNRYNTRQIVIGDPAAGSIRVGGSFRPTNTAAFLRLLQEAYGLRVTDDGQKITIAS